MLQMTRRTLAICALVGLCFGTATSPANPRKAAAGKAIPREGDDRKQEDNSPSRREPAFDLFKEKGRPRRVSTKVRNVYFVELKPGTLLSATVQQRGIDVSVDLFDPLGKRLFTIDSHNSGRGPEPVLLVAEQGGEYRLVISTSSTAHDNSSTADYLIESIGRRLATARDRQRASALRSYYRARALDQNRDAQRKEAALLLAEQALRAAGERGLDADALTDLGAFYLSQKNWRNGVEFFQRAASGLRKLGRKGEEAVALNEWGTGEQKLNQAAKAQNLYTRAAHLAREAKDAKTEASSLTNLGNFHAERGEAREAGIVLQRALEIWSEAETSTERPRRWPHLAFSTSRWGRPRRGCKLLPICIVVQELEPEHPRDAADAGRRRLCQRGQAGPGAPVAPAGDRGGTRHGGCRE